FWSIFRRAVYIGRLPPWPDRSVKREVRWGQREESVMDWEPIKRTGKPDPRSVDERTGTTRIVLHFPISASPPREWREFFESRHRGQEYPPPSIQEAEIIALPLESEEDFITWTENVDRDIQLSFVGLLAFYDADGEYMHGCTGTLISPAVVLTAAHCTTGTATAYAYFSVEVPDDFREKPTGVLGTTYTD